MLSLAKKRIYKEVIMGAGFQLINGLNIHAGYGLGLKTITGQSINYYQEKNRVLSVGFGFSL